MVMLILFILTVLLAFIAFQKQKRTNFPPGPFPWPFIGNQYYLERLCRKFGGEHWAFLELCKHYNSGIISLRLGGNNVVVVSDTRLVHQTLNMEEYDGRPWNEFAKLRNLGMQKKGITMNDGAEWKELRGWAFRNLKNMGFARRTMGELLANEQVLILKHLKEGNVHRIKSVIEPSVINVLWKLLAGGLTYDDTKLNQLFNLTEQRAKAFDMSGGIISSFPWLRYIMPNITGYNIIVSLNNKLMNLIMTTIDEHKNQYVEGAEADLIDLFLYKMMTKKPAETENSVFTDDNLIILMVDFFFAGSNTTTSMLDSIFLHMLQYQDVQDKLHKEIDNVIGSERLPNLEDRSKMPFAEAIITECQRMYNVTPVTPRRILTDMTLGGYTIPKNTTVMINFFASHMDPQLYPDPTSFKPERFVKDGAYQSDNNLLAFGKGKRRCPGEALAKSALFLFFISVMQKYRLIPVPGEECMKIKIMPGLIHSPEPYKALFVPR